jgi:hypothetical protein
MTNSIVSATVQSSESPFDLIRRYDQKGNEWWSARDLQKMLGYRRWDKFIVVVEIGSENLESTGVDVISHVIPTGELSTASDPVPLQDYKLSRIACYHIALACDSRGKPEVKAAKHYFATKTREAELMLPALSEKLEIARLDNESLKLQLELQSRQDTRIALHGLATTLLLEGKSDAVIEIEKPVLEVIDQRNNTSYKGQTLTQVKDFLLKKHGLKYKTGADIKRVLEQKGMGHLVAQTPRSILSDYVPSENQQAVYDALVGIPVRQMLLGE